MELVKLYIILRIYKENIVCIQNRILLNSEGKESHKIWMKLLKKYTHGGNLGPER